MKKLKILLTTLLLIAVIPGCWDMTEIDRRLFIGTVGVDKSPAPDKKYAVHFTAPIVRMLGGEGGGGGGPAESPMMSVTSLADSVTEALYNLDLRLNRFLFLEHASIFVIGEEAAREGIRDIISPFWRNMAFNRRCHIAIAQGTAEEALKVTPKVEQLYTDYLARLFEHELLTGKYFKSQLGYFMSSINSNIGKGNTLVAKIVPGEDEVYIGGAAVIKDYKLVGWLSPTETQGINLCLGTIKGGALNVEDESLKGVADFHIFAAKRKIHLVEVGDIPKVLIEVYVEGDIESSSIDMVITEKEVNQLCCVIGDLIRGRCLEGIARIQEDFQVDVINLGEHLYKFHPKVWKKYEDNWERIFPQVEIDVKVDTKIRGLGVTT